MYTYALHALFVAPFAEQGPDEPAEGNGPTSAYWSLLGIRPRGRVFMEIAAHSEREVFYLPCLRPQFGWCPSAPM